VLGPIGINYDSVGKSMAAIAGSSGYLPSADAVEKAEGAQVGVTLAFHNQVKYSASVLAQIVRMLQADLSASEAAVRQTVADMVAKDESLSDEARVLLTAVDSITRAENAEAPAAENASPTKRAWK
jgi:3-oxoacyl-ACP reductase-like protein